MRILQIGKTGQLALELSRRTRERGHDTVVWSRADADLDKPEVVAEALRQAAPFDVAIIAAAYTGVDKAETDEDSARRVNADSVRVIGEACAARNVPVIHVSTDYVFSGDRTDRPSRPEDPVGPTGAYGRTKLAGEAALRDVCTKHVIIRTAWVYSVHGHNFVKTMLRVGRERDALRIVSDQRGCPTEAGTLAEAVLAAAELSVSDPAPALWGIFHYTGAGETSWYDFARTIFELAPNGLTGQPDLAGIASSEYPTPARRPASSALDCSTFVRVFNVPQVDWRHSLKGVLNELAKIEILEKS
tara:strand:+ start:2384 stop:3289 length:906 start_codon:yes stop_codon:yes gene_type:complete